MGDMADDALIEEEMYENNMEKEKHFAEGIYLNTVNEKAPEFIKANVSIHIEVNLWKPETKTDTPVMPENPQAPAADVPF